MRGTMAATEQCLAAHRFTRVHRSRLVNLDRIRELVPTRSGEYRIVLDSGDTITGSRRFSERLRAALAAECISDR